GGLRGGGGGPASEARVDRDARRRAMSASGRERRNGRIAVVRGFMFAVIVSAAAVAQPRPLTLDEAVKLGLQRHSDLQRQLLLSLSAEQDRIIARSAILPTLDFNASIAGNRQGSGN